MTTKNTQETSQELAVVEPTAEELAIAAGSMAEVDTDDLIIPVVKLTQPLTKEVVEGDADTGVYFNTLTYEDYGEHIKFVVAGMLKGRFQSDDDNEVLIANPDSSGVCPCHGLPWNQCPNCEEQFRAAVNRGDQEWGDGPPISTTYNFFGFVVPEEDTGMAPLPARISLMRTAAKSAKKWNTMLRSAQTPWGSVFDLGVKLEQPTPKKKYYVPTVRIARASTPDERQVALRIAQAIQAGAVTHAGEEPATDAPLPPEEPASGSGLDID